jgi:ribonuclease J
MTMVEYERDIILLDCGGKFPEEEQRGIDLVLPDVTYVRNRVQNLRGILITHGHEDHIGGLPYIIPQFSDIAPVPIYGSPLTLGLIERKLEEHRLDKMVKLIPIEPNTTYHFGQLSAEFIHVTHSIPDTNAIAVHSPVGTILDTADFKFDPTPVMGKPTDERRLRQLGDEGVLALFSDTVRVESDGSTPSEQVVMDTMDQVIGDAKGMVLIATFASNISRIHMALRAAHRHGRKVAVAGRSMEQNAQVSRDLGYIDPPEGLLMPIDEVLRLPRNQRVLVITGSQGEASAALARIAAGEHPKIRVTRGDVAMLSATPIPGNEETVSRTINNLFRRGIRVVYSTRDKGVHVSGHAGRDELRRMIDLIRPRFAVPIHGEYRHMMLYQELCAEAGIPNDRVMLPEIGGVIEFTKDSANQRQRIPSGSILLDRLGDRGGVYRLREREHLFDDGVVVVTMVVDRESGQLIAGPDLVARDLKPDLANGALREAELELRRTLQRRQRGEVQIGHLIQRTKESVGRVLYRRSSDKTWPMILPVVTEL